MMSPALSAGIPESSPSFFSNASPKGATLLSNVKVTRRALGNASPNPLEVVLRPLGVILGPSWDHKTAMAICRTGPAMAHQSLWRGRKKALIYLWSFPRAAGRATSGTSLNTPTLQAKAPCLEAPRVCIQRQHNMLTNETPRACEARRAVVGPEANTG